MKRWRIAVILGSSSTAGTITFMPPATPCSRSWYPIEVLHFPVRSSRAGEGQEPRLGASSSERRRWGRTSRRPDPRQRGDVDEYVTTFLLPEHVVQRGLAEGSLVEDVRLRDVLRELARTRWRAVCLAC